VLRGTTTRTNMNRIRHSRTSTKLISRTSRINTSHINTIMSTIHIDNKMNNASRR
jgi:hypothetical protein